MKTLHRNRRTIYLCQVYEENGLRKYKKPIKLRENYHHYKGDVTLMNVGMDIYDYLRIRTTKSRAKYYHLGDRIYINVEPPKEHDVLCKTADYEVFKDPMISINECEVPLRKMSGKRDNRNIF